MTGGPCDRVRMRLIAVTGASPGIGKSALCTALTRWLAQAGLSVDQFEEDHVLSRPAFATVAVDFTVTGAVSPTVLIDATVRYLADAEAAGVEVVVMDSLVPYVPSLLAFGHSEQNIAEILDELAARIATIPTLAVFLDGDAATGLRRAAAREGPEWLRWYAAKLARYGLVGHDADLASLSDYLARERDTTLHILRRQPWDLIVVDHADKVPPDDVFHTVVTAVMAFLPKPPTDFRRPT